MRIGFRSFRPPILANVSLIFALFSASRHLKPFEASNGFIWNHLKPKNTSLFVVSCRENDVFLCGFDACGPPSGGFWCPKATYFTSLFELLHLSRDDERKSTCFTVFLCITTLCFALLDHKFWSNVSSNIALLAGLSPLPHFLRFSPPETDECIG